MQQDSCCTRMCATRKGKGGWKKIRARNFKVIYLKNSPSNTPRSQCRVVRSCRHFHLWAWWIQPAFSGSECWGGGRQYSIYDFILFVQPRSPKVCTGLAHFNLVQSSSLFLPSTVESLISLFFWWRRDLYRRLSDVNIPGLQPSPPALMGCLTCASDRTELFCSHWSLLLALTSSSPASVCVVPCDFRIKFYHLSAYSRGRKRSFLNVLFFPLLTFVGWLELR